jgi:5-formyltetrahydrofolate cyclo-ligase
MITSTAANLSPTERRDLRKLMRERRNAVLSNARVDAAERIAKTLRRSVLRPKMKVAIYSAFDGEIDLTPTMRAATRLNCELYAPRIVDTKRRRMEFIRIDIKKGGQRNPFGMLEPRDIPTRRIHPRELDLILVAMIAFDAKGWRLGFGGGFYDRKLSFKRRKSYLAPLFVGVAYDFQRVATVDPASWDVLLDAVVTPQGLQRCNR